MQSTWRTPNVRSRLALGACFLHAVPGAIGGIETSDGERFVVAHRSDALLTPCQLRAGLLEPPRPGVPHLSEIIRSVDVTGGVVDIGAGLYQRSHPAAPDERWFATTLHPDRIMHIARDCPTDLDHAAVAVDIKADAELGASAVLLRADRIGVRLDAVACWLHGRCLVDELIDQAGAAA